MAGICLSVFFTISILLSSSRISLSSLLGVEMFYKWSIYPKLPLFSFSNLLYLFRENPCKSCLRNWNINLDWFLSCPPHISLIKKLLLGCGDYICSIPALGFVVLLMQEFSQLLWISRIRSKVLIWLFTVSNSSSKFPQQQHELCHRGKLFKIGECDNCS